MKGKRLLLIAVITVGMLLASVPTALAAGESPPRRQGRAVRGEVTAVADRTLTVDTPRGAVVVVTDEGTVFRVPGVEEPSITDIAVGDHVVALGRRVGRTFHARQVAVVDPEARPARVGGQVTAIEGGDITVNTRSGETVTVRTDADTAFRIPGVEDPGLDDVQVGALVGAAGTWNEDGSLQAAVVFVPRESERQGRLVGEVAAVEGTALTLSVRGERQITLQTDEGTAFYVPGVEGAALDDVQVGDRVAVEAEMRDGTPYAVTVLVWPEHAARLSGQVTAVEGTALTVETAHGPVQVLTDGSTLFRVAGVEEPSLDDVQVGDRVACGGTWEDEATFRASAVVVRRGATGPGRTGAVRGRVVSVDSDRLTVGTARGPVTVLVGGETALHVPGVENPTLADIQVGDGVGARGQWNEEGALVADEVVVRRGAWREVSPGSTGGEFSPPSGPPTGLRSPDVAPHRDG